MTRPSIPSPSSLFLMRSAQQATGHANYILESVRASSGVPQLSANFFELGIVPRRGAQHPLGAAIEQVFEPPEAKFFGDVGCLASIINCVLPALLPRRRYAQNLRFWSADCATGERTYSLAIALAELCPGLANWNLEFVASDADASTLARARQGSYTASEVQRGLPSEWLVRYFEPLPDNRSWIINPRTAERMRWLQLDLAQNCALVGVADVVICHREFGTSDIQLPLRRQALANLTNQLATDGFLILESPEKSLELGSGFQLLYDNGPAVYRRIERDASLLSA